MADSLVIKRLLALDTVTQKGSIGVFQFQNETLTTLSLKEWSCGKGKNETPSHSERLPLAIQDALNEAQIQSQELDVLAVDIGPGRWTGVRTGINTIKALAFAIKKPIYALNSLCITAEAFASSEEPVTVAFNAFKNSVYYGEFLKGNTLVQPCVLPFAQWREKNISFCVGDVAAFYELPKSLSFQYAWPRAENIARIFFKKDQSDNLLNWRQLNPLYLRSI